MLVTTQDIQNAYSLVQDKIRRTPLTHSSQLSSWVGSDIYVKYENRQRTGSFKIRGALNKIASLSEEEKARGLVASSAGNHAQGVAYAASALGVKAKIVMPKTAPLVKIQATKGYGAEVVLEGDFYDEAYSHALDLAEEHGFVFVHPYEDKAIISGQGTVGLEIVEDLDQIDNVVVSIGGGGLISGISTYIKDSFPKVRIIGVQAKAAPAMAETFRSGKLVEIQPNSSSLADGVSVKKPSQFMYDSYIKRLVDEIVTVGDEDIAQAIAFMMERSKTVLEGSGALPIAAVMSEDLSLKGNTVLVASGGNIDLNIVSKVIEQGLKRSGRRVQLSVLAQDIPGTLNRLTEIIAKHNANILEVVHDRASGDLFLRETKIHFVLETTDQNQIDSIKKQIQSFGCRII